MDDIQELYQLFPEIKEHIHVEKKVGQGSFSFVYMGYFLHDHEQMVALKYIIPTSSPSRTKQEIECLLNIGGEDNVVGVHAVLRNKSHILILMPYVQHVAFHDSFLTWSLEDVREYMRSLLIAMNRVHRCGIIHRDIKPSNFLYDSRKKIYALVDFGLAQRYEMDDDFDVFNSEKLANSKSRLSNLQNENTPKHNMIELKSLSKNSAQKQPGRTYSPGNVISIQKKLSAKTLHANTHCFSEELKKSNSMTNSASYDCDLNKATNLDFNLQPAGSSKLPIVNNFSIQPQSLQQDSNKVVSPTLTTTQTVPAASAKSSSNLVETKPAVSTPAKNLNPAPSINKSSTPNLQKYFSFQRNSFASENKCTCYNMPFVCDICTTRNPKWAPRAGTAGFRAPEVLFRSTHQTPAVDIWSVGIIFLSLLSGRYPFFKAVDDVMAIMQLISLFGSEMVRKAANKYGESLISSYDQKAPDLKEICQLLRKNAILRFSMRRESMSKDARDQGSSDELFYEFPDAAYDLLKQLLEMDCDKRISAQEALNHPFFETKDASNSCN